MFAIPSNITRAGRYIGTEPNRVVKEAHEVDVRFALCYPDVYEIGMSYFGLFLLYELLNSLDRVWCERCFAPWHDMEAYLKRAALPLSTLESRTPLSRMDMVGFSLTYELNVTNVLNMLSLGGLTLRAGEREDGPIVIGGGPLMLNPTPYESFFDLVVVGEADEVLVEIVGRLKGLKGLPRSHVIGELAPSSRRLLAPPRKKERAEALCGGPRHFFPPREAPHSYHGERAQQAQRGDIPGVRERVPVLHSRLWIPAVQGKGPLAPGGDHRPGSY